jgi:hypothetical protein
MQCNASYTRFNFLEGFSYVLQIDMHFICTPMWTKFYSCKKWVLQHQAHHQPVMDSSYTDFLAMHPPTFIEAADPLEADNWLCVIDSKFGLLHCTEFQKTL